MGLKETIKETKEKLEEAVKVEEKGEEKALETFNAAIEKAVEEPKEEIKEEVQAEAPKEEIKADDKKPEEKTPSEHREERIAKKKEKDRLAEELAVARERIAALEANSKPKADALENEPDIQTQPLEWTAWKIRKQEEKIEKLSGWKAEQDTVRQREDMRLRAINEVSAYENNLRVSAPDYDDVKDYYARVLATSIKIVNPNISNQQLAEAVNNRLLTRASELLNQGYENPIEAMYLEAKSLGYKPKEEAKSDEVKPDLDKVASLRKRNAGMAGSAGGGNDTHVSPTTAAKMTNAEFAKLKPEQKKRLFAQLSGG